MKISSVSKKILAGALSAAMVVAFSPAAALGAPIQQHKYTGVVTKAPTDCADGQMTFTCSDCNDTYTAIIPALAEHDYIVDEAAAGTVKGWAWDINANPALTKATVNVKCEHGNYPSTAVTAVVTYTEVKATATTPGSITYTAVATPATHQSFTATKTVVTPKLGAAYTGAVTWIDNEKTGLDQKYTGASLFITGKDAGANTVYTKNIAGTVTTSVAKGDAATCAAPGQTTYTAVFDLPAEVADYEISGAITGTGTVKVANGKVTVTTKLTNIKQDATAHAVVKEDTKAYVANENILGTSGKWSVTYKDSDGYLSEGTSALDGEYNLIVKCSDNSAHVIYNAQPTSVTRTEQCDAYVYTFGYTGGEFKLTVAKNPATATAHVSTFEGFEWNEAMTEAKALFKCSTCGAVEKVDATVTTTATTPATCQNGSSKTQTASITALAAKDGRAHGESKVVETGLRLNHVTTAGATASWTADKSGAVVSLKCGDCTYTSRPAVTVVKKYKPTAGAFIALPYSATATFSAPQGVAQVTGADGMDANGDYYFTADYAGVAATDISASDFKGVKENGLPTNATDASLWTVAGCTVKSVVADAANSVAEKCAGGSPNKQFDAYTVTYTTSAGVDKTATVVFEATNLKHTAKTIKFNATSKKFVEVCGACGASTDKTAVLTADANGIYSAVVDGVRYAAVEGDYTAVETNYGFAATGAIDPYGKLIVTPSAKFVKANKDEVVLGAADLEVSNIELITAANCRGGAVYSATVSVKASAMKKIAGYTGETSGTVVFSDNAIDPAKHLEKDLFLVKATKASASSAGKAQYYCNACGKDHLVTVAKDNMKVSPASKTFKASTLKKSAKSFTIKVTNAKGKVSYKSSSKKVTVSSKGKVTVKKGTAKGTYKVTVTSKATALYKANTKTVTIKVK